jgi:hypothetical protein
MYHRNGEIDASASTLSFLKLFKHTVEGLFFPGSGAIFLAHNDSLTF